MKSKLLEQIKEIAPKLLSIEDLWTNRDQHYHTFLSLGFPDDKVEQWRQTPINDQLNKPLYYVTDNSPKQIERLDDYFSCPIENFEKYLFLIHNGAPLYSDQVIFKDPNTGMIAGSLRHAFLLFPDIFNKYLDVYKRQIRNHPELIKKYLGTVVSPYDNFYAALNSAVFSDRCV